MMLIILSNQALKFRSCNLDRLNSHHKLLPCFNPNNNHKGFNLEKNKIIDFEILVGSNIVNGHTKYNTSNNMRIFIKEIK